MNPILYTLSQIAQKSVDAFHPLLIFFLLLGLVKRRAIPYNKGEFFLASLFLSYMGLLFLFSLTYGYMSKRHLLPLVGLCLPWMAVGLCEILARLESWTQSGKLKGLSSGVVTAIVLGSTLLIFVPKTFKPQRDDKIVWQEVGLWIKAQNSSHSPVILSRIPQIAFYAEGKNFQLKEEHYKKIVLTARREGADYLVLRKQPGGFAYLFSPEDLAGLEPLKVPLPPQGSEDEELIVFRIKDHH